jgi:hypothetical protein
MTGYPVKTFQYLLESTTVELGEVEVISSYTIFRMKSFNEISLAHYVLLKKRDEFLEDS